MILRRIHPPCRREAERHYMEETCSWMASLSLNASLRPQLSQRPLHAGQQGQRAPARPGVPLRGRPPGAGVRKEVARVVEGMVRRLEVQERREQADAATAQLMLLTIVRKGRLRVEVGPGMPLRVWRGETGAGAGCM